jgi:hypothetical protein
VVLSVSEEEEVFEDGKGKPGQDPQHVEVPQDNLVSPSGRANQRSTVRACRF